jgi:hypothetical protein
MGSASMRLRIGRESLEGRQAVKRDMVWLKKFIVGVEGVLTVISGTSSVGCLLVYRGTWSESSCRIFKG